MAPRDQLPLLAQRPSLQHIGESEGDKGTHEWCNGHTTLVQTWHWELCTCMAAMCAMGGKKQVHMNGGSVWWNFMFSVN